MNGRNLARIAIRSGWMLALAALGILAPGRAVDAPVTLESRLEPFVDRWLIDRLDGLDLVMHSPTPAETALVFDKPWEGSVSAYFTTFQDDGGYRMYYRGLEIDEAGKTLHQVTCMAESVDGIRWTRPDLGIYEFEGTRANNIVWAGEGTHNFAPFKDTRPRVPPDERYKALAGGPLIALTSADGLHWRKLREQPVITQGAFDSLNLAFWSEFEQQYVCYFRVFVNGVRAISRCVSPDFIHWSTPRIVDLGPGPVEHLYTSATTPYFRAPHIYLALPKRFFPERKAIPEARYPGVSDGLFMTSRDGVRFDRTFPEAFVRPGLDPENWNERNIMAAWGVVPTGPGEISFYYSNHYRHPTSLVRRMTLRTDGFASVHGGASGGEMATRPFTFTGGQLRINYSTSAGGSVRVELQDENRTAIPGFALNDCDLIYGDRIDHVVRWRSASDVSALAGRTVRLRAEIKDGDLYAIQFTD